MRLLDRYLLRELLVPLGYCLCGFLLLWLSSDLIANLHDLQEKKLLVGDIFAYYLVRAPSILALILPLDLLLALLYTLTNHARHHEITAIRAAGVSLWRLSLPYFAVGFVASLCLFALNEYLVPDSNEAAEQVRKHREERVPKLHRRKQGEQPGKDQQRENNDAQPVVGDAELAELERAAHPGWRVHCGMLPGGCGR